MSQIAFPKPDPAISGTGRRDPRRVARVAAGGMRGHRRGRPARLRDRRADRLSPPAARRRRCRAPPKRSRSALKFCREQDVNIVPRGAGTSLAGGAVPQEDAIVIGLSKMNRILEINYADRYARVEAGVTNLAISEAVAADGFFYAPDPSSQLACTIGGNIAMNSGGAHCLKYGVTINNLLGVRLVTFDGEIVDHRRPRARRRGPRFPRPDLRRRGPARHRHRGVGAHSADGGRRAARAVRLRQRRRREPLRRRDHRRRHRAGGDGVHGQARHRDHREFRPRRLSRSTSRRC